MAYFRAKLQSEKIVPETNVEAHQRSMQESFYVMQISKLMTLSVVPSSDGSQNQKYLLK